MTVPPWVQDAIFYQIFPDRFANGDPANDPVNVEPWGSPPTRRNYQGGDLRGVIQKLDYLLDLGVNAIYLNPIFHSTANHRYHTIDYYRIDPFLGTMEDFRALLDATHAAGVRVVLDGVFNHSGRGFFAFSNVLENEECSPYKDWYHIHHYPVDAFSQAKSNDYEAWWRLKGLPKFNTDNPQVRAYLMDVARYWVEQGIDGWRLDVPDEIDDDSFWAEFRHTVKNANPDAYLVGEIWKADPRWVGEGHFDGLMNYPLREAILDLLAEDGSLTEFAQQVEKLLSVYPRPNLYAMYLPLGSHDTERLSTALEGDLAKIKLALAFQFAFPGAPAVYYGDEVGIEGGEDPDNRQAFPWDEGEWNHELRAWVQHLIATRKATPALRRGDFQRLALDAETGCYVFSRTLGGESLLVVANCRAEAQQVNLPVADLNWEDGRVLNDLLGSGRWPVSEGLVSLAIPPWGVSWLAA